LKHKGIIFAGMRDCLAADAWIDKLIASDVMLITADYRQPVKAILQRYATLY